jgi:hypothetical protein
MRRRLRRRATAETLSMLVPTGETAKRLPMLTQNNQNEFKVSTRAGAQRARWLFSNRSRSYVRYQT